MKICTLCVPRSLAAALVVVLSSLLAGCSGEPSASDVDKKMRADAVGSKNIVIHEIRKIGCAAAQGAIGYMCDIEVDATLPQPFGLPPQRNKKAVKLRFYKDGGEWKVSGN